MSNADKIKQLEAENETLKGNVADLQLLLDTYLQKSVQLEQQVILLNKKAQAEQPQAEANTQVVQ